MSKEPGKKVYAALIDGMFRVAGASYQQVQDQFEQKDRYLSAHATPNVPTAKGNTKASSSSAAQSTRKETTGKTPNVIKDQNPTRGHKRSGTGRSGKGRSNADKGSVRGHSDQQVASGSGLSKNVAIRGSEARTSTASEATATKDATVEGAAGETENQSPSHSLPSSQKISSITIIAEVKRMARANAHSSLRRKILIQESAQMAAWIADVPMLLGQTADEAGTYR